VTERTSERASDDFRVGVGFIAFCGLLLRLVDLIAASGKLGGDGLYYHAIGPLLADGKGFIATGPYALNGTIVASARHPPAWPLTLAGAALVGLRSAFDQQLVASLIGTATIVLIAFAGRRIAGERAGLIAAVIAALYPIFWLYERELMSETLTLFGAALTVLLAYRFRDRPSAGRALGLGFSCALLALNHAEQLLLVPFLLLPLILFTRDQPRGRRVAWAALATAAVIAASVPWAAYNSARFHTSVPLGTANGMTLVVSNCPFTYYGPHIGFQDDRCRKLLDGTGKITGKDEVARDNQLMRVGRDYIRHHLSRLPLVMAAREGRVWSVFNVGQQMHIDTGRKTNIKVIEAGYFMYWLLIPAAILGLVVLRRRRVTLIPLVALFVTVAVGVAFVYGFTRFRASAEVAIVLLAAVGVDAWLRRRTRNAGNRRHTVGSSGAEEPAAGIPVA
jgi:4-amino-4-deoxy-L-arabinose transferase-like glycosyltransferase